MEKRRILYIDDEPVNLQLFRLTFQNEFEITTTEAPAEGLRLLEKADTYSVVISDMRMPKITGLEILTRAKELQPLSYRILVTGLLEDENIESAIANEIVHIIVYKPWAKAEFLEILRRGHN